MARVFSGLRVVLWSARSSLVCAWFFGLRVVLWSARGSLVRSSLGGSVPVAMSCGTQRLVRSAAALCRESGLPCCLVARGSGVQTLTVVQMQPDVVVAYAPSVVGPVSSPTRSAADRNSLWVVR
jgi:hypothetical protein